jgi:hypothetical protein
MTDPTGNALMARIKELEEVIKYWRDARQAIFDCQEFDKSNLFNWLAICEHKLMTVARDIK